MRWFHIGGHDANAGQRLQNAVSRKIAQQLVWRVLQLATATISEMAAGRQLVQGPGGQQTLRRNKISGQRAGQVPPICGDTIPARGQPKDRDTCALGHAGHMETALARGQLAKQVMHKQQTA